jgi:hypothetical protein
MFMLMQSIPVFPGDWMSAINSIKESPEYENVPTERGNRIAQASRTKSISTSSSSSLELNAKSIANKSDAVYPLSSRSGCMPGMARLVVSSGQMPSFDSESDILSDYCTTWPSTVLL